MRFPLLTALFLATLFLSAQRDYRPYLEFHAGQANTTDRNTGAGTGLAASLGVGITRSVPNRWLGLTAGLLVNHDNFTSLRGYMGSVAGPGYSFLSEATVSEVGIKLGVVGSIYRIELSPWIGMGYWLSGRFEGVEIASNGERKETFSGQIGATVEGPYHRYRIDVDDRIPRYAGLDLGYRIHPRWKLSARIARTMLSDFRYLKAPLCATGGDCSLFEEDGIGSFGNIGRTDLYVGLRYTLAGE